MRSCSDTNINLLLTWLFSDPLARHPWLNDSDPSPFAEFINEDRLDHAEPV